MDAIEKRRLLRKIRELATVPMDGSIDWRLTEIAVIATGATRARKRDPSPDRKRRGGKNRAAL